MRSISVRELTTNGSNVPVTVVDSASDLPFAPEPGAQRFRQVYSGGQQLDALLVNRGSRTLVVSLHGALDRKIFSIPRFERLRSLLQYRVSSMFLADPCLHMAPALQLAWFTGWREVYLPRDIARWIQVAAEAVDADRIVLTGSSGGGFAALMLASLLPDSVAVLFNPQLDISLYEVDGAHPHAAKRAYVRHVWPDLAKQLDVERFDFCKEWATPIAHRTSAVARFAQPRETQILYVSNRNDTHHHQVHLPALREAVGPDPERFRTMVYDGPVGHHPPSHEIFDRALREAARWTGFDLPLAR